MLGAAKKAWSMSTPPPVRKSEERMRESGTAAGEGHQGGRGRGRVGGERGAAHCRAHRVKAHRTETGERQNKKIQA